MINVSVSEVFDALILEVKEKMVPKASATSHLSNFLYLFHTCFFISSWASICFFKEAIESLAVVILSFKLWDVV